MLHVKQTLKHYREKQISILLRYILRACVNNVKIILFNENTNK